MPYCIIHKRPVFLFKSRYDELAEKALNFRGDTLFCKNLDERSMYKWLKIKYRQDPKKFETNWVRFNLVGMEAKETVCDLLYDYSCYCGHTYLSDYRDFVEQLEDSYSGISMTYPMGRGFALHYRIRPLSWFSLLRNQKHELKIDINTRKVERVVGDLSEFNIITKDFILSCGKDVSIIAGMTGMVYNDTYMQNQGSYEAN